MMFNMLKIIENLQKILKKDPVVPWGKPFFTVGIHQICRVDIPYISCYKKSRSIKILIQKASYVFIGEGM